MKMTCFWLTPQGKQIAQLLEEKFDAYVVEKNGFSQQVQTAFITADVLVFIMATGIVVRMLAPLLHSKQSDPAVLVIDQQGNYVISLLSGHLGGANAYAIMVADAIGAQPVITTATDLEQLPSFDLIAKENHLYPANLSVLKTISGALLAGESVDLISTLPIETPLCPQLVSVPTLRGNVSVWISDRIPKTKQEKPVLYLHPASLVIGIGCKHNTNPMLMRRYFFQFLEEYQLSRHAVCKIATIKLKQQEPCIRQLCEFLHVPLTIVPDEEIQSCSHPFERSAFVESVTGLPSVAEACSYLASGCGTALTGKIKYPGITFAAYRRSLPPLRLKKEE